MYPLRNPVWHSIYCNFEKKRCTAVLQYQYRNGMLFFPFVLCWLMVLSYTGPVHLYRCSISNSISNVSRSVEEQNTKMLLKKLKQCNSNPFSIIAVVSLC